MIGGIASENRPRLFTTSSAGNDPDVGGPNEKCTPSSPGRSAEGEPSGAGPNSDPLGNESISVPDDNVDGGSILRLVFSTLTTKLRLPSPTMTRPMLTLLMCLSRVTTLSRP